MNKTLDELFGEWIVLPPGHWEQDNCDLSKGYWAVKCKSSIIALFSEESDAWKFRKDKVNRLLRK